MTSKEMRELDIPQFKPKPVVRNHGVIEKVHTSMFQNIVWWVTFIGMLIVCATSAIGNMQIERVLFN